MHFKKTSIQFLIVFVLSILLSQQFASAAETNENPNATADRPNILWLTIEDIGPHLGCYGDPDADTPTLDAFAKRSLTYDIAWSNYPVCAPARTTIISGMYAAANSAGNMRSEVRLPDGVEMFPYFLKQSGYYCTNSSKTDYNFLKPKNDPWDESSKKAHYRNRADGQPFFAVFNYTGTHESKIRTRPHNAVIDPASVTLPSYWPDTPDVRQDWAQYHDNIHVMDGWIKKHLDAIEKAGLTDNTIVLCYGDHGSGMPRHKRFAGDSGMRVPFIVHIPEKYKQLAPTDYSKGGRTDRPVGFVDLAPTTLSLIGIEPPKYMQGHAFAGKFQTDAPKYAYGFRDRMDERPDLSRSLRDEKYIYVRNYFPHLPAGQHVGYQFVTPTTSIWHSMFEAGQLNDVQSHFWQTHPPEELYDLVNDADETKNLIDDPQHAETVGRFRAEHQASYQRFGDLGLIPESIALQFEQTDGETARSRRSMLADKTQFPLDQIFRVANHAANFDDGSIPELVESAKHESATLRYWGALGLLIRGEKAVQAHSDLLVILLDDSEPTVAIAAAEALAKFGDANQKQAAVKSLIKNSDLNNSNYYAAISALNAVDRLRVSNIANLGTEAKTKLKDIPIGASGKQGRGSGYIDQLIDRIKE